MFNPCILNPAMNTRKEELFSYEAMMDSVCHNFGNSYISYSLHKHLFGGYLASKNICNNFWMKPETNGALFEKINGFSHAFLVLQDYIRPKNIAFDIDYDYFFNFIKNIKIPLIVPNVGINALEYDKDFYKQIPEKVVRLMQMISDRCTYIGVRGAYTQETLDRLGIKNTIITGCPSYFENGKDRKIIKHENIKKRDILCTSPYSFIQSDYPSVLQGDSELDIIKTITFDKEGILKYKDNAYVLKNYWNKNYHCFTNISDWKNYVKKFKIIAGRRIHGSILAMNSGVCPVLFVQDFRAREMLDFFGLPYFEIKDIDTDILKFYERCNYTKANNLYNGLYQGWVDFMHKNGCLLYWENPAVTSSQKYDKQPNSIPPPPRIKHPRSLPYAIVVTHHIRQNEKPLQSEIQEVEDVQKYLQPNLTL